MTNAWVMISAGTWHRWYRNIGIETWTQRAVIHWSAGKTWVKQTNRDDRICGTGNFTKTISWHGYDFLYQQAKSFTFWRKLIIDTRALVAGGGGWICNRHKIRANPRLLTSDLVRISHKYYSGHVHLINAYLRDQLLLFEYPISILFIVAAFRYKVYNIYIIMVFI